MLFSRHKDGRPLRFFLTRSRFTILIGYYLRYLQPQSPFGKVKPSAASSACAPSLLPLLLSVTCPFSALVTPPGRRSFLLVVCRLLPRCCVQPTTTPPGCFASISTYTAPQSRLPWELVIAGLCRPLSTTCYLHYLMLPSLVTRIRVRCSKSHSRALRFTDHYGTRLLAIAPPNKILTLLSTDMLARYSGPLLPRPHPQLLP